MTPDVTLAESDASFMAHNNEDMTLAESDATFRALNDEAEAAAVEAEVEEVRRLVGWIQRPEGVESGARGGEFRG
jgi:hypothetical protein